MSFALFTASKSLIFVWQWSSTRFSRAWSSRLLSSKDSDFFMPFTEPKISSPSRLSMVVAPRSFKKAPTLISLFRRSSSSPSPRTKSFAVMESVKSVTEKIKSVLPLFSI